MYTHLKKQLQILGIIAFHWAFFALHTQGQVSKNKVELEDIWARYRFSAAGASDFNWMKDDRFYSVLEEGKIEKYSIESQKSTGTILDMRNLESAEGEVIKPEQYSFSPDEKKVLLMMEIEPIYRHSSKEKCFVYDLQTKQIQTIQHGAKIAFATFSPDGSKIAYMFQNDLYFHDFSTGKPTRVTQDGALNSIINGGTDWVHEEEFAFTRAFFWNADGTKLAFYRFDETKVREFSMDMYGSLYPEPFKFKYPKAGEENATVELFIHDLGSGGKVRVDIGPEKDQYIPRISWTRSPTQLAVMRMNRLQNTLELLMVDAKTGSSNVVLVETESEYVEQPSDKTWHFLENGKEFLWQSERSGYNHVYLYALDGKLIRQITDGKFDVADISAVDEKTGTLFYISTEDSPMERHLYQVQLDGSKKKRITKEAGWHDVSFSSGNHYYLDSYSNVSTPGKTALYEVKKGKQMVMLQDNSKLAQVLQSYEWGNLNFLQVPLQDADDTKLNAWMITPPDFDVKKKYPVLMHVYGGPGSQTVKNAWGGSNYIWHQMLAQKGYIVVSVDNRGTGGRGEAFKKCTYGQLGRTEADDQISAAKYLGTLPYVDASRIGIWGWSFGGYMTSLCLTKGNGVFKMGIAVAPVTSWRFYDTIYTERYLKTPALNPSGYDDNSPIQFASGLSGKYLLVHGTADDNVHYQNALEMTDALVRANKQFEMAYYPNKNHGIYGGTTRLHLYTKMTDFVLNHL